MDNAPQIDRSQDTTTALPCPLCDYDLRGLVEPRCPECGFQFDWTELRDRQLNRHRYLIEHHRGDRVKRFVVTLLASTWPWNFWGDLRPTHEVDRRRLVGYWCVLLVLTILAVIVSHAGTLGIVRWVYQHDPYKSWTWRADLERWEAAVTQPYVVACLLWPWLTYLALMIFHDTMRQTKIRASHVLRCTLYSYGPIVWMSLFVCGFAAMGVGVANVVRPPPLLYVPWMSYQPFVLAFPLLAMMCVGAAGTAVAYRRYLTFPNAVFTIGLTQVLVGLTYACAFFLFVRPRW